MLASLSDLGYSVEWRVVNSADYGFPQRRKRVFILAEHNASWGEGKVVLEREGVFARALPIHALEGLEIIDLGEGGHAHSL